MLMYMNDRQHIIAYVKLLGILQDYSWDKYHKCQRTAIMISAIQLAIVLCLQSSCHFSARNFSTFQVQTTYTHIYNFGREVQTQNLVL